MSLVPPVPRFMLRESAITVQRSKGTAIDSEGDPTGGRVTVLEDRGTFAAVSATEQLVAQQRGTQVDKALQIVLGLDVREGDWITGEGSLYEAVTAEDRRLFRRLLLRKIQ